MDGSPSEPSALRFGTFRLELETAELYKNGTLIKLQPQPFKVLALLAGHTGQLVTREQLQQEIWGRETFVDFEKGLNFCIKQIRDALGTDADAPRYIETLPRRGYRFIAPVEVCDHSSAVARVAPVAALGAQAAVLPRPQRWSWLIGGAAAVLAGVAALALWHPWRPRLVFQQRDWVLIASFENRTGEPIFDGTLEYALERELSNSRFVNVVPRDRILDTFKLMRKPADTRLDGALGREVCLRDGGIRALLTGRIEKLDTAYLLSAQIVDPIPGVAVASVSEEATSQREVVQVLRRMADGVRAKLGEALPLINQNEQKLAKVTTPSLKALQLYSQASVAADQGKFEAAIELMNQAVAEDSSFASAHLELGIWYGATQKYKEATPHFQRARELADTATDPERYRILGYYAQLSLHDDQTAAQEFEAWISRYPDDAEAVGMVPFVYWRLGRWRDAIPYVVRLAQLRPNDFGANLYATEALATWEKDLAGAHTYLERARALVPADRTGQERQLAWLDLFPAYEAWLKDDVGEAQRIVDRVAHRIESQKSGSMEEKMYGYHIAFCYLTLGELDQAERWAERLRVPDEPELRLVPLAIFAFARGNGEGLRRYVAQARRTYDSPTLLLLRLRAEPPGQAEKAILAVEKTEVSRQLLKIARGELALARGETTDALQLLEEGIAGAGAGDRPAFFLGSESLAKAYEQRDDLPKAIQVLERASKQRPGVYPRQGLIGYFWVRTQSQLAQLYRKAGRDRDARKIEDELLKLLAYADSDYPMLLDLNRLQNSVATHSAN